MSISFDSTYNSTDHSLRNRNYTILIRKNVDHKTEATAPVMVVGAVKSEFQFNQNVQWETFWGGPEKSAATTLLSSFGVRLIPQVSTVQVWDAGGSELELSVEFDLHAWSSPELDVMSPVRSLLAMTNPSIDDKGMLRSPGAYIDPTALAGLMDTAQNNPAELLTKKAIQDKMRGKVSLSIGRWIYFDNIAVTGVQVQLHTDTPFRGVGSAITPSFPLPGEGAATGATVVVNFKPMFMFTQEDLEQVFMSSAFGVSTPADVALLTTSDFEGQQAALTQNDSQMELIDLFDPLAI